jgi:hypothetical protein
VHIVFVNVNILINTYLSTGITDRKYHDVLEYKQWKNLIRWPKADYLLHTVLALL